MKSNVKKIISIFFVVLVACSVFSVSSISANAYTTDQIVTLAKKQVGKKYEFGKSGPDSFDCVGLVKYVFEQYGISLPMGTSSYAGTKYEKYGTYVAIKDLQPGDVLAFGTDQKNLTHLGIYIGDGLMVNALNPTAGVKINYISKDAYDKASNKKYLYYTGKLLFGIRIKNTISTTTSSTSTETASTLAVKNQYYPSMTYAVGSPFTISGEVTSNYTISDITVKVETTSGTQKFAASVNPNSTSYSLYNLDSKMTFSKLPEGNYVYTVTAKDTKETKTLIKSNFSVKASNITSSGMNYPTTLAKGSYFTIKGTVGSSDKLKSVTAIVHTVNGVKKFSSSVNTNAKTYNVYNLDPKMTFKSLPAGEYIYRVSVVDAKGIEKFVVSKKFVVK